MIPQGCATEEPQDQVMIRVVSGFLGGNILEQTMVCPEYIVLLGPHLLSAI